MSVSETNFLEMSAHVLLKVAPKGYFRGKKPQNISIVIDIFLKQNRGSTTKKIGVVFVSFHEYNLFSKIVFGSSCKRFIESSHQSIPKR